MSDSYKLDHLSLVKVLQSEDEGEDQVFLCEDENKNLVIVKSLAKTSHKYLGYDHEFDKMKILHEKYPNNFPKVFLYEKASYSSLLFKGGNYFLGNCEEIAVYEYIEGIVTRKRKEVSDMKRLRHDILDQLSKMHSIGFVHNDVALRNIVQKKDGSYVLIDFGKSFSMNDDRFAHPHRTCSWVEPELLTEKTDFYELGLITLL